MKNSVYTYKTIVEDTQHLFPTKYLPTDDIDEIHEQNIVVQVIEELRGRGNGIYILKLQPGVGKSLGTSKYISKELEEGKTFIIFSRRQELLFQIQQDLIEEGINPDKINRLQGFQRAFPDYPARDENGKLVEKDASEMTELEKQVKQDYQNGASPNWIIGKYEKKLQLDHNPWKEQFKEYEGKVVLAPLDYLTQNMKQIRNIISAADSCFIDEVPQKPYSLELNTKPSEAERFLNYMTSKHQELYEETQDDFIDNEDTPVHSKAELSQIIYGDGNAFKQANQLYRQLLHHSAAIRKPPKETLDQIVDISKDIEEMAYGVTPVSEPAQYSRGELMIASDFLTKLKYKLYTETEPETYNPFLGQRLDLTHLLELKNYADYGKVEINEKLEVHKEEEIELNKKNTLVDTENYQKGTYEKNGEPRAYLKIKDESLLEDKIFDGRIITSRFQNQEGSYLTKYKHAYQDILKHSANMPVLLLDATCKPEQLTTNLIQYAYNRRAELDRDNYPYWKRSNRRNRQCFKYQLNNLDKLIITELDLIEPYLPIYDKEAMENKKEILKRMKTDWGGQIPDWNTVKVESMCKNKDSTIVRLKSKHAQEQGSFSRTYSSFIQTLEAKLNSKTVPPEIKALGKEGYGLISYKGEIIDQIRKLSEHFTEENTTYFYGLRGTNHLKDQDALQVGTPYINPDQFQEQLTRWLEMDVSFESKRRNGWHIYPDKVVQAFHEVQSMDEQYQAIQRARPLIYDITIGVMGRIPPAIKKEVTVKTPSDNSLKEYAVNQRFNSVIQEQDKSQIISKAKKEGLKPEELGVELDLVGKSVMDKLSRLDRTLTFQDGVLRKDRRYKHKDYRGKVKDFIEGNEDRLEGLQLTQFKQRIKSEVKEAADERVEEVIEEMRNEDLIKTQKVEEFPETYEVSLNL